MREKDPSVLYTLKNRGELYRSTKRNQEHRERSRAKFATERRENNKVRIKREGEQHHEVLYDIYYIFTD